MLAFKDIFNDSYLRILSAVECPEEFIGDFYDAFLTASPEMRERLSRIDMERQRHLFAESLLQVEGVFLNNTISEQLEELGVLHSDDRDDIGPGLYDLWLNSLMKAVSRHDPEFSPEVELAWRLVLAPGIAYMKLRHEALSCLSGDACAVCA